MIVTNDQATADQGIHEALRATNPFPDPREALRASAAVAVLQEGLCQAAVVKVERATVSWCHTNDGLCLLGEGRGGVSESVLEKAQRFSGACGLPILPWFVKVLAVVCQICSETGNNCSEIKAVFPNCSETIVSIVLCFTSAGLLEHVWSEIYSLSAEQWFLSHPWSLMA